MSIKAINQEALDCFNVSVLFFIISVSCFFLDFENNRPGGGVLARFFCPRDRGFALSLCARG